MKTPILFLVFSMCAACGPTDKSGPLEAVKHSSEKKTMETQAKKPVTGANELIIAHADTLELIDDDFVGRALGSALQYKRIIRNRAAFQQSSAFEQNEDNPALQDSINRLTKR